MAIPDYDKLKDKEKVAVLESRIQFQNEQLSGLKSQFEETKSELINLREQLDKFASSAQNQTAIITEQQRTLKDQEKTILEQQMSLSELQKQLIELQKKLDSANTEILKTENTIREKTDSLKAENLQLRTTLEEKQADFDRKVQALQDTITKLRTQITDLEKKEKELSDLPSGLSTRDTNALDQRISELEKTLQDADATISRLEGELENRKQLMTSEIEVRDVKIKELERLIRKQGVALPTDTGVTFNKDDAAIAIKSIFSKTKSNVMMFIPDVNVLNELDFENLRPVIRVQIATPVQDNRKLTGQLAAKSNIEIRNYTEGQIWGIIRDNEELLLAPINDQGEPMGIIVKGATQIDMFGNIMRSTWTRLKRI
ncbi:MAG: hypothetical protein ACTSQI_02730 [Candidatus Helarchaeota archaeon]